MTDWVRRQQVYSGSGGPINNGSDTWHWSSAGGWTLLSPATSPESASGGGQFFAPRMVYDTARGNVVAYFTYRAQTWIWDGSDWSNASPATKPNIDALDGFGGAGTLDYRSGAAFAYDEAREVAVLFGGVNVNTAVDLGDTWTWNGTNWTLADSGGPARENSAMAYDRTNENVVLFGGFPGTTETWLWNGSSWTQVFPATTPPGRQFHSMSWNGSDVIMYGGFSGSNLGDTWTWDGTDWTLVSSESEDSCVLPDFRRESSLAYDEGSGFAVLFGGLRFGSSFFSDLWTWGGSGSVADAPHPLPRSTYGGNIMAWDGSQMVLYGGDYNPSENSFECPVPASFPLHLESRSAMLINP